MIDPVSPLPHGFVTESPSYAALHPSSAGHTSFGTTPHRGSPRLPHADAVSSSQTPSALQNRCFSPKYPVPHGSSAVDSAGVSGQPPSAGHMRCTRGHRGSARLPQMERSGTPQFPLSSQTRVCVPMNPAPQSMVTSVIDGVCGHSPVAGHWFRSARQASPLLPPHSSLGAPQTPSQSHQRRMAPL